MISNQEKDISDFLEHAGVKKSPKSSGQVSGGVKAIITKRLKTPIMFIGKGKVVASGINTTKGLLNKNKNKTVADLAKN